MQREREGELSFFKQMNILLVNIYIEFFIDFYITKKDTGICGFVRKQHMNLECRLCHILYDGNVRGGTCPVKDLDNVKYIPVYKCLSHEYNVYTPIQKKEIANQLRV